MLSIGIVLLGLTACSGSSGGDGACSEQVISDYNDVYYACATMTEESEAPACKSAAQSFVDTHEGISCKAQDLSGDGGEIIVTTAEAEEIVRRLEALGI